VLVEACDACKVFLKTVNLTISGNADPLVDELASIPVTLFMGE
jgi:formate dehydrogenase maturation protein FdhE